MRRLKFINGKLIWITRLNDIITAAKTYPNFKSVWMQEMEQNSFPQRGGQRQKVVRTVEQRIPVYVVKRIQFDSSWKIPKLIC